MTENFIYYLNGSPGMSSGLISENQIERLEKKVFNEGELRYFGLQFVNEAYIQKVILPGAIEVVMVLARRELSWDIQVFIRFGLGGAKLRSYETPDLDEVYQNADALVMDGKFEKVETAIRHLMEKDCNDSWDRVRKEFIGSGLVKSRLGDL